MISGHRALIKPSGEPDWLQNTVDKLAPASGVPKLGVACDIQVHVNGIRLGADAKPHMVYYHIATRTVVVLLDPKRMFEALPRHPQPHYFAVFTHTGAEEVTGMVVVCEGTD